MPDWKVARDIGKRIEELQGVLGVSQEVLAKRAGVWPPQVSNWVQGKQKPTKRRLTDWAQREGWPLEIFAEGGKRPAALVNSPVNESADQPRGLVREKGGVGYGGAGPGQKSVGDSAADAAQAMAGTIILTRMAGRTTISAAEAIGYLAAVVDAAAGRPVKLPPGPETEDAKSPTGRNAAG